MKAGDLVEVLPREELLATLTREGTLDRMPFQPEMLQYCGKRFRVSKVAHKTCDTAHRTGARSLKDTYHLEDLRCDGSAHGGCQATCLFFWKGAWLRKVEEGKPTPPTAVKPRAGGCTEKDLAAATLVPTEPGEEVRYSCQATKLFEASAPLRWWSPGQYVCDVTSGNWGLGTAIKVLLLSWFRGLVGLGIGYRASTSLYRGVHRLIMGQPAPSLVGGDLPKGAKTPTVEVGMRPGEWVRVRPYEEIRKTLNVDNKNRGLWFDQEMVPVCGKRFQVASRVDRILDEQTGRMLEMKNPCIVLKGVNCTGRYTELRLLCPRAVTTYWREAWLERDGASSQPGSVRGSTQ
jgi:hypothetical protein